jgi:hypothetical protein
MQSDGGGVDQALVSARCSLHNTQNIRSLLTCFYGTVHAASSSLPETIINMSATQDLYFSSEMVAGMDKVSLNNAQPIQAASLRTLFLGTPFANISSSGGLVSTAV